MKYEVGDLLYSTNDKSTGLIMVYDEQLGYDILWGKTLYGQNYIVKLYPHNIQTFIDKGDIIHYPVITNESARNL